MNAVSRFDAKRPKLLQGFQRVPAWAPVALYAAGVLIAAFMIFQLFFRYQYFQNAGALWRVDRLTQRTCRYSLTTEGCIVSKFSPSTSTSTSLSTSVYLKGTARKKH